MTALAWLQLPRPTRTGTVYMGVCAGLVAAGGVAAVASARHVVVDNGTVAALLAAGLLALWPLTGLLLARLLRRPHILPARRTPVSPQLPSGTGRVLTSSSAAVWGSAVRGRPSAGTRAGSTGAGPGATPSTRPSPLGRVPVRGGTVPPLPAPGHPLNDGRGACRLYPADPANRDHQHVRS